MRPWGSTFAIIVGPQRSDHPSFPEAFESGIVLDWVDSAPDLWRKLPAIMFHDIIVFDTRLQSEEQCHICRAIRKEGQVVVCLGCDPTECSSCFRPEPNLLRALAGSPDVQFSTATFRELASGRTSVPRRTGTGPR